MEHSESSGRQIVPFVGNHHNKFRSWDNSASLMEYYPPYAPYHGNPCHQRRFPSMSININPDGMAVDSNILNYAVPRHTVLFAVIEDRGLNKISPNASHTSHISSKATSPIFAGWDCATFSAVLIILLIAWIVYFMK